jgi:hypothetical protein
MQDLKHSSRSGRPSVTQKQRIDDYTEAELLDLVLWIQSDQVLRSDEQIMSDLLPELGFQRRGSRILERLSDLILKWRRDGLLR